MTFITHKNTQLTKYEQGLIMQAEKLHQSQKYSKAIVILNDVIVANPYCALAYENLGDNYISLRDFKKAEKAIDHSLKINPTSVNGLYLYGFLMSSIEKWPESIKALVEANVLKPHHPEILRCLGWATFYGKNKKKGLALLERSHMIDPKNADILCDLGICYLHEHDNKKAKTSLLKAAKMNPGSVQIKKCLSFLQE